MRWGWRATRSHGRGAPAPVSFDIAVRAPAPRSLQPYAVSVGVVPAAARRSASRVPQYGVRRFDGAVVDRLTSTWLTPIVSIDAELRTSLDRLRARSRDQFKNNEYAKKFAKLITANVVGADGFQLQMRVRDPSGAADGGANNAIEDAFDRWSASQQCDVRGQRSFVFICVAAALSLARDGEFLIRKREGVGAGDFGYQLQNIDVDRLDTLYNLAPANGRNAVIMGVEVDQFRKPVAYWLWDRHPQEDAHAATRYRERVPASEIFHGFIPLEDEQVRGVPWLHPVLRRVKDLDGYREAAVIAARVGASKMGFFESPDGQPGTVVDGQDDQGNFTTDASPGQFDVLPAGYKFNQFNPDYPHAQFDMFCKSALRGIASGLGVAYHSLANDLEGVNFSSIRSGTLEERDEWKLIQKWFIDSLLEPIFNDWLPHALLQNQIVLDNGSPLPLAKLSKFRRHTWQPRRWQWVDPLKDMAASVLAIENGLASPQQIAAEQGRDIDEVIDDLAEFQSALKAKGVVLTGTTAPTGSIASAAAGSGSDAGNQNAVGGK